MIKKSLGALLVGVALTLIGCPPPPDGGKTGTTTPPAGGTGATTATTPATTGDAGKTGTTAPATPPPAKGIDLSHLKKGEKFTYVMQGGVQMVWTITDIVGTTVKYTTQSMMDMGQGLAPVGDPTPAEFPHVAPVATTAATTATAPAGTEISREKVKVGNVEFDCMVSKTGDSKSWISMQGDMPVFPGCIKSMQGANAVMELTKVEGN
jgi:hypothetical protein